MVLFSFCWNLDANLKLFWVQSFRFIDRSSTFCTKIITRPNPNSTADNMRKKNVRDIKFKLSNISPEISVRMYRVIQRNSAVNKRCKEVLTFIVMLANIIIKSSIIKLISPKVISYTVSKLLAVSNCSNIGKYGVKNSVNNKGTIYFISIGFVWGINPKIVSWWWAYSINTWKSTPRTKILRVITLEEAFVVSLDAVGVNLIWNIDVKKVLPVYKDVTSNFILPISSCSWRFCVLRILKYWVLIINFV